MIFSKWYNVVFPLYAAKLPQASIQQSTQQNPLVPIMQECVDAISEHQKLRALMKGEWVKGLLPQSSVRADYTVQRIRGSWNWIIYMWFTYFLSHCCYYSCFANIACLNINWSPSSGVSQNLLKEPAWRILSILEMERFMIKSTRNGCQSCQAILNCSCIYFVLF